LQWLQCSQVIAGVSFLDSAGVGGSFHGAPQTGMGCGAPKRARRLELDLRFLLDHGDTDRGV
jgi:hypothetical protein